MLQILLLCLGKHSVDCLDAVVIIIMSSSSVDNAMISEERVMGVSAIISCVLVPRNLKKRNLASCTNR